MEVKENRPDACAASGTANSIYKDFSTDAPDIQEELTGPVLPDECAADIVSFCSEQTIAYDDLLEYATLFYLQDKDPEDPPFRDTLKFELLTLTNRCIDAYNFGKRDPNAAPGAKLKDAYPDKKEGAERYKRLSGLHTLQIAIILYKLHHAVGILWNNSHDDGNFDIGIYQYSGDNEGCYDVGEQNLKSLIRGYPCIFVAGFSAGAGASAGTIGYQEDVAPTLKGSPSGNCMPSILCINDQGGQIMECSENITGTLRAQEHGHQPLVLRPGKPLLYENYGIDSRYTGPHKIAPTLSARMGTGGLNTSIVQQVPEEVICIAGNAIDRQPQNGGNGFGWQRDISYTLTTSDRHSVYARQRVDQFRDDEIASTESARQHKDATDLICQPPSTWDADCRNLIRRLTPLECERLQGYPDGWTDVPGASDSARYKALGNSVAIPCVEYLMQRVAMVITLGLEWEF